MALDAAPNATDYRRDRWGRPLVVPASGGKAKPYTRSSSAAKAVEDTYGLELWARRNVAYGLAMDPSLVARVIAVGGNPSTWEKDDKAEIAKVCEDAAQVAQAHKSADIGTAVHRMVERLNRGETVEGGPYQADLDAYREAVTAAGWTINPEHVECRMVCDELEMAGTCDMIVQVGSAWHVADLKTGSSVAYGGLGYAAQLAAYARGSLYDVAADDRIDTPPLDRSVGYIVHLPAGEGRCTIYTVDLERGFAAAQLANQVRAIRTESKKWIAPIVAGATSSPADEAAPASQSAAQPAAVEPEASPSPPAPAATKDASSPADESRPSEAVQSEEGVSGTPTVVNGGGSTRPDTPPPTSSRRDELKARVADMERNAQAAGWHAEFVAQWRAFGITKESTDDEIAAALDTIEPPFDPEPQPEVEGAGDVPACPKCHSTDTEVAA